VPSVSPSAHPTASLMPTDCYSPTTKDCSFNMHVW
jgi:hypothetical protein